ncbi:E1-E2 ATPase-domain-containing protein [Aspergillus lucknowensis]|uniref:E1-E2 ATPase-domain-containing protein n=1 Tax=Aspergillus lucknowensis TaxID=176173 RepID=A0ABR4M0C3_9EURO
MGPRDNPLPPQSRLTVILVNNLHCPSCTTNVEETLSALQPPPFSISTSIIRHEIEVVHPVTLSTGRIVRALEDVAFEVDSVIPDAGESDMEDNAAERSSRSSRSSKAPAPSKLHISKCDACRAQFDVLSATSSSAVREGLVAREREHLGPRDRQKKEDSLVSVVDDHLIDSRVRVTLSVSGISCSSCVSKITRVLQSRPWVQSADVNLLTSMAVVTLIDKSHVDELLKTVRETGYFPELIECHEARHQPPSDRSGLEDRWRASYVIQGMTCSSCVGKVTDALKQHEWITTVNVNLLSANATVELLGKDHLDEIPGIINRLGYTAILSDVEKATHSSQPSSKRSMTIHVKGMHCSQCPQRILDALTIYSDQLEVTAPPSMADPKVTVSYLPLSPKFTIRHIMRTIANIDNAFTVSVYHPPSLEERSQAMHRRHQWQIARRLILAVIVAIPTFIIGVVYMSLVTHNNPGRMYLEQPMWSGGASRSEWALFIMSTPVYFFAADIFHRRMLFELKALWRPGSKTPILRRFYRFGSMDMLMSLGTSIAYFSSIAILAINASQPPGSPKASTVSYFEAVVFLTMFLLIGRVLEAYSKAKAGDAVRLLGKLRPTEATLVEPIEAGSPPFSLKPNTVPIDQLEFGDIVRVASGASPPYDGLVVEGESQFDESSLTGESKPVSKSIGDEVFSGTVNQANPVLVRVTRLLGDSMLDQIINAVRQGQIRRAPIERTADLITSFFVPVVTLITVLDWLIWLGLGVSGRLPDSWKGDTPGDWGFWSLQFAIAVFVIACPCGIGLAAPTALFVGGGLAARHGILVKGGGEAFQEASQLDCVIFDKTGTITEGGEPSITDHEIIDNTDADQLWGAMKELEQNSSHPIARAVVSFATSYEAPVLQALKVEEIPGKGMKGSFGSLYPDSFVLEVIVGNEVLMQDHGIIIPSTGAEKLTAWKHQAKTVVLVAQRILPEQSTTEAVPWKLSVMLAVADAIRTEAKGTVQAIQDRHIAVWMISGDNPTTAYAVGTMVGIPEGNIIAGVLPEQKAEKIHYLQKTLQKKSGSGRALVAMVGDGINDSPALTAADVGIAIGSGSDIAISAAEFVLVSSRLSSLLTLIDLSRVVFRRIKFNFAWALVYNCVSIPVAAGVLYPIVSNGSHIRLDPVWASLAMALSSVSVVSSSLLMKTRLPIVGFRSND